MKIFILFFTLGLFSGCECETYIYVHRDLVGDAWMSENKNCSVDYDEAVVTIDMEKTSETQRKLTPAQWLKENTAVIDYNKSYNNIACIHTINDPEKYKAFIAIKDGI